MAGRWTIVTWLSKRKGNGRDGVGCPVFFLGVVLRWAVFVKVFGLILKEL